MTNIDIVDREVTFASINDGDWFIYTGDLYIKCCSLQESSDEECFNAICIEENSITPGRFNNGLPVIPVKVEITAYK